MYPLGVAPEDNFQQAQADMLAGVISDLEDELSKAFWRRDQEEKARALDFMYSFDRLSR